MKTFPKLFFLISITTIFCSCTITKRHFGRGYHIEWNQKHRTGETNSSEKMIPTDEISSVETVFQKDTIELVLNESTQEIQLVEEPKLKEKQVVEKKAPKIFSKLLEAKLQMSKKSKNTKPDIYPEEEEKKRMHPLMWGIWGMWSIAIACMFFVTFYTEALIGVGLGFFIAMIFAIIVLRSLRKHPGKYRFKGLTYGFGIPAIVFGAIATFVGIICLLLLVNVLSW